MDTCRPVVVQPSGKPAATPMPRPQLAPGCFSLPASACPSEEAVPAGELEGEGTCTEDSYVDTCPDTITQ